MGTIFKIFLNVWRGVEGWINVCMHESKTVCFIIKYLPARQEHVQFFALMRKTVPVGWKWDGRIYVIRCRAEGHERLLLERTALSPLKASAHPEPHWEITHHNLTVWACSHRHYNRLAACGQWPERLKAVWSRHLLKIMERHLMFFIRSKFS